MLGERYRLRSGDEVVAALAVVGVAGFGVGHVVMNVATGSSLTSRLYADSTEFRVYSAIVSAQVAFWLMACPYLWHVGSRVASRFQVGRRAAWRPAILAVVAIGALLMVPFLLNRPGGEDLLRAASIRVNVLYALGLPVFVIALLTLVMIETAGNGIERERAGPSALHDDVLGLQTLQNALRQSLQVLGVVVSLVVVATGALMVSISSFKADHPERTTGVEEPSQGALIAYGALFVGILLLMYLPAARAVADAGDAVVERHLTSTPTTPVIDQLKSRTELLAALGLGSNPEETLKRSVAVLSPLLTGALSYFLS